VKTFSQLRAEMDEASWQDMMEQLVSQKLRFSKWFTTEDVAWIERHLDRFGNVMRDHVARKRWKNLDLSESEQRWLDSHQAGCPELALVREVMEQRKKEIELRK
jgi:hypothetical protein